ncbi:hypothetical protein FNF27_00872 [Cafeteria roenbergensis]|uniref:Dolichol-phosphate mannosyltransferase subunit 1 n=1 Tax=Cafeteria roenbergensis TaxID=33653 RepID=A0A5A8DSK8_CAFRO|nr:hypothetical protein FNF29_08426 [Cafeteria roenbergensis]KAA0156327.1 hypothetical protein FNF29_01120 [Cafeteria roenbergensis]KAA0166486.1 hypothetical protein FNF28_03127 [Cafeteria roenbergensis]KAA0168432.1 hypothetical protein FNF31_00314 [Cafeteria roenbergensis]KAA0177700.1 hypothetical protein FNF27_00872 [Cafeteria roenbergensis]|eukprot:KAA0145699.1 hypothetical protein FNF29_08426 [Cafeteria roenbergensis]
MADSSSPPSVTVILPTYEEVTNLPLIVFLIDKHLSAAGVSYQVLIVEDSSPDGTMAVALRLQKVFPGRVRVFKRAGKLGLGSAYMDALKFVKSEFVVLMDADMSHHPKEIPVMLKRQLETGCDIVTGTRYRLGGGVLGWDLRRKLTSRVANFLATLVLSPGASDLTGSFRLYKRDVLEDVLKTVKSKGYVFQMEVIVRADKMGYSIEEIPISFVDRIHGASKLGAGEIVQYLKGMGMLFFEF